LELSAQGGQLTLLLFLLGEVGMHLRFKVMDRLSGLLALLHGAILDLGGTTNQALQEGLGTLP